LYELSYRKSFVDRDTVIFSYLIRKAEESDNKSRGSNAILRMLARFCLDVEREESKTIE